MRRPPPLVSYEKQLTVVEVLASRSPVYVNQAPDRAFKVLSDDQLVEEVRKSADIAAQLRQSQSCSPVKAWGAPNKPQTGSMLSPNGGTKRVRPATAGGSTTREWTGSSSSLINTTGCMSPPAQPRPRSAGGMPVTNRTLTPSSSICSSEVLPAYIKETTKESSHNSNSLTAAARVVQLESTVAQLTATLKELRKDNATLRRAAVGEEEVQRVEVLAAQHKSALDTVQALTDSRAAADKALKAQAVKQLVHILHSAATMYISMLTEILQLERALRAATVQQKQYSTADVSVMSSPTSAVMQSPVRKLSANQAATLAQQQHDVYNDADDTANAFSSECDDTSIDNNDMLLECSATANSGDMCLPDEEPLAGDSPTPRQPTTSAISPELHMRSAARTASAAVQAWSSSSKDKDANGGDTSPVTSMTSPSKTSKSPATAIKRGLQAELHAAAEEEAYLKEKEQKRLRNLAHSKPPEGLLNRARDAALSKQERE
eukprot:10783-Heterococcus_DN1.PRE.1